MIAIDLGILMSRVVYTQDRRAIRSCPEQDVRRSGDEADRSRLGQVRFAATNWMPAYAGMTEGATHAVLQRFVQSGLKPISPARRA